MSAAMNASTLPPAEEFLEYFTYDRRDLRTEDWPLVSSPWTVLAISLTYLAFAVKILPGVMATRKPLELKFPMNAYNLFQVVGNLWLVYSYLINGWGTTYNYGK
jgi:hypothetical protein